MLLEVSSLRREAIGELEMIFHQSMDDPRVLLALEAELDRRSTPRARELRGRVRQQISSRHGLADARVPKAKRWYRRGGVLLSIGSVVVVGIAQGVFHAVGFHMWQPMWQALQDLGGQVGVF
jgi:hypothetical protein